MVVSILDGTTRPLSSQRLKELPNITDTTFFLLLYEKSTAQHIPGERKPTESCLDTESAGFYATIEGTDASDRLLCRPLLSRVMHGWVLSSRSTATRFGLK